MANIEIDIKTKKIEFLRLTKNCAVHYDRFTMKTYVCKECGSIVTSKVDHTRWHQDMLEMVINISHGVISLEEARQMQYQPIEVNP